MWLRALSFLESRVYGFLPRRIRIWLLNRQMARIERDASVVMGEPQTQPTKQMWNMSQHQPTELN